MKEKKIFSASKMKSKSNKIWRSLMMKVRSIKYPGKWICMCFVTKISVHIFQFCFCLWDIVDGQLCNLIIKVIPLEQSKIRKLFKTKNFLPLWEYFLVKSTVISAYRSYCQFGNWHNSLLNCNYKLTRSQN